MKKCSKESISSELRRGFLQPERNFMPMRGRIRVNIFKKMFGCKNECVKPIPDKDMPETNYIGTLSLGKLSPQQYKGLNFLVVDDNIDQLSIVEGFLEKYGALVDKAENGKLGLEAYLENPLKYDIIFMDIQMPVMKGDEAAKKIRESGHPNAGTIPLVAISANSLINNGKDEGFNFFLSKPFHMEQLAYIIDHIKPYVKNV